MSTDIVSELSSIGRELNELSYEIARLDRAAVYARGEYRKAYARKFLSTEGSVETRKQVATLDVEDQLLEAEIADQLVRAARERIRVLRDRLEIGRSLNAARRAEFAAEPVGQPA
ncbi:hypothetical protein NLU66_16730 [Brachybacterium sp. NBEC-018]|uniref:hypothetical protein n=1 Tax=Brachybacterium sp. NBEC-018 TaxID=2996004 RepID=UPI00217525BF|nr:hypothetical protein [Brachybacterium sp. NBEC-018]UVY83834.1 hypothetical protein NLU66_16730 [Brachybacterium sp. NBEC-018]